jgi:hypothetical protein
MRPLLHVRGESQCAAGRAIYVLLTGAKLKCCCMESCTACMLLWHADQQYSATCARLLVVALLCGCDWATLLEVTCVAARCARRIAMDTRMPCIRVCIRTDFEAWRMHVLRGSRLCHADTRHRPNVATELPTIHNWQ